MENGLKGRLRLITEAGKLLTGSLRSASGLQQLADLMVSTIADICAIDILGDDGQQERLAIAFPNHVNDVDSVLSGHGRSSDPVFHVPLPMDGGKLGEILLVRLGESLGTEDLEVAEDVARMAAMSLENARLYQRAQKALLTVRNQSSNIRRMNESLECRVTERTIELEAANREMSIVNYTVSHDLRAPLRAIQGYSQILLEDYDDQLPPEARGYVNKLVQSTGDVNQLLDGLLTFCKMSSHQLQRQDVALDALVRQSLDTLRGKMTGRKVEVRIGELNEVYIDPMLVKQVFINLLSNALTYTSSRDVAVIDVGHFVEPGRQPVFYVKDNGIGFDPRDEAKLFQPFRRLHASEGYEGTGVGLSIVSSIIQRHGGRIWASGNPNAGATFYFTLGLQKRERLAS